MQTPEVGAGFSEQRQDDPSVERILKMQPKVECSAHSMKLEVQNSDSAPGSLFLINRGIEFALPWACIFPSFYFF